MQWTHLLDPAANPEDGGSAASKMVQEPRKPGLLSDGEASLKMITKYKRTNSTEQSLSSEANSHSAVYKFPTFMEPGCALPCSQQQVTGPYPEPDASGPQLPTQFP
jgi:hypothetical protein